MTSRHLALVPTASLTDRLIIVGCSAEKTENAGPLPALDLYDGGCVPALRSWAGADPRRRDRIRFLSAEHGWVTADTPLGNYDRPLDAGRAAQLRPQVWQQARLDLTDPALTDLLVIAEPLYLVLLTDLLAHPARPAIHWISDHAGGWPPATDILHTWGWT